MHVKLIIIVNPFIFCLFYCVFTSKLLCNIYWNSWGFLLFSSSWTSAIFADCVKNGQNVIINDGDFNIEISIYFIKNWKHDTFLFLFSIFTCSSVCSEWVSDCCLTPTRQFSAISWREQVIFNEMMMRSALF